MKKATELSILNARILLACGECELTVECSDSTYYHSIWNLEEFTDFVKVKNKNGVGVKVYIE